MVQVGDVNSIEVKVVQLLWNGGSIVYIHFKYLIKDINGQRCYL